MKTKDTLRITAAALVAAVSLGGSAEVLDRPGGIKIGDRMTLRPYVTASLTYDSNVRQGPSGKEDDFMWSVSPSLWLNYNAETWSLLLTGFYTYHEYFENKHNDDNYHTYGQDLRFNWSDAQPGDKGWALMLGESFQQQTMADDMVLSDGSHYNGDSRQFQFSGALQRRITECWHADVNAGYYWLDYENSTTDRNAYYGWDRWSVGGEVGFAPSRWTDFIVNGNYSGYTQDNTDGSAYSNDSESWAVQAGLGSYMTERISYRVLAGWSRFEYADGEHDDDGFVYTVSGNWKIGETWNTMLLCSSYYQPSERQYASSSRTDALSWGLSKLLVRGKLRANLDLRYRRETHDYALSSDTDYDYVLDIITGRFGLNYSLNRFFSCYGYVEYQDSMNDSSGKRGGAYDYERFRATIGVRLSY